jgi:hypothetical protein
MSNGSGSARASFICQLVCAIPHHDRAPAATACCQSRRMKSKLCASARVTEALKNQLQTVGCTPDARHWRLLVRDNRLLRVTPLAHVGCAALESGMQDGVVVSHRRCGRCVFRDSDGS